MGQSNPVRAFTHRAIYKKLQCSGLTSRGVGSQIHRLPGLALALAACVLFAAPGRAETQFKADGDAGQFEFRGTPAAARLDLVGVNKTGAAWRELSFRLEVRFKQAGKDPFNTEVAIASDDNWSVDDQRKFSAPLPPETNPDDIEEIKATVVRGLSLRERMEHVYRGIIIKNDECALEFIPLARLQGEDADKRQGEFMAKGCGWQPTSFLAVQLGEGKVVSSSAGLIGVSQGTIISEGPHHGETGLFLQSRTGMTKVSAWREFRAVRASR